MLRASCAAAIALAGGGSGLFAAREQRVTVPGTNGPVAVLSPGTLPTTDFYFRARAALRPDADWIDTLAAPPGAASIRSGSDIVIVRHAPRPWLQYIEQRRAWFGRIVWFIDDDVPAALQAAELPLRYALKTAWRFARMRRWLLRCCDEVWVSTAELQRRYAGAAPRLLAPLYLESDCGPVAPQTYFYHGTWAHRREIAWLVPVVRRVQELLPEACFEVVGGAAVRRLYRGIPRVTVRAPESWPAYLARAQSGGFQLGLAPCLDTPFNRARAHVKFYDITRFGAAGIYARAEPYAQVVQHGASGWLCDDRPETWVREITQRLGEPAQCALVRESALAQCRAIARRDGGWP